MKRAVSKLVLLLVLAVVQASAWAGQADTGNKPDGAGSAAKVLVYIQPVEYTNPISLSNHYSNSYWFEQGPIVEPLSLDRLKKVYGAVGLCEVNQTANVLVWLQPRMFYNPQAQLFYGQVTASVYSGKGEFMSRYVGKSKVHGFLDIKPEMWIEKAYAIAIDKMAAKMQADKKLQQLADSDVNASGPGNMPCGIVSSLPVPKIRALSF